MTLYILRHGDAGPSVPGPADDERHLTDKGEDEVRRIAKRLADLDVKPDVILTSPLPRAAETADITARELKCRDAVRIERALSQGAKPGDFQAMLGSLTDKTVMVVGHEPDLSGIIGWLTGARVALKKAGFAKLNCDAIEPGRATLDWLLTPKVLK